MGFPSVLGYLRGMGAVRSPKQNKDWAVTAVHLGGDGDVCSLLWIHLAGP